MPVDPTDPETFETNGEDTELAAEVPEADAAEQLADVRQHGDEPLSRIDPATASEGDAAEQARAVEPDEEEDHR